MQLSGHAPLGYIPMPSLRINTASVAATLVDLIFLAMAWEYLGKPHLRIHLWLRAFLTLLGVMWLDVILFATGAFAGTPGYLSIMQGTLISRLVISLFACPFLWAYLKWQSARKAVEVENRPVLAILKQVAEIKRELTLAQQEIERRKRAQREREKLIGDLQEALSEVKTLRGFLPICAHCKKIRDDEGYWQQIEMYIQQRSEAQFSHGICPECARSFIRNLNPVSQIRLEICNFRHRLDGLEDTVLFILGSGQAVDADWALLRSLNMQHGKIDYALGPYRVCSDNILSETEGFRCQEWELKSSKRITERWIL